MSPDEVPPSIRLGRARTFAHDLDVYLFGWPGTPHTSEFTWRVDTLVQLALGTPADKRKPPVWIKSGTRWRIEWSKLR